MANIYLKDGGGRKFSWGGGLRLLILIGACYLLSADDVFAQCYKLDNFRGYSQNFDTDDGFWVSDANNNAWVWGNPSKRVINGGWNNTKCWMAGGLTGDRYTPGQKSILSVGCFDFTNLPYPYVEFKIFWETGKNDGAAFQYSLDDGVSWHNVGNVGDEKDCWNKNWFNSRSITSFAGLSTVTEGWSGNTQPGAGSCAGGGGSGQWVTARHDLYELAGKKKVLLRFIFASGNTCNEYDGVAIDDFSIVYRERLTEITYLQFTSPDCNGQSGATAVASVPDYIGIPPYNYSWTNGITTYSDHAIYKIPAGPYTVTVTDGNNCKLQRSFIITEPPKLSHTVTIVDAECNGTGSATIHESGGTPREGPNVLPYKYEWNTTELNTGNTATGLKPGKYTVRVTDAKNCLDIVEFTVGTKAVVSFSKTDVTCFGEKNGSATASFEGTPPYQYSWSTRSTEATIRDLAAGTYTVTVTDSKGCSGFGTVTITGPAALVTTMTAKESSCGNSNGEASVAVSGGMGRYTYAWTPGNSTDATIANLAPGNYSVVVTDANGCQKPDEIIVTTGTALTATTDKVTNVSCFGGSNGSATIVASGTAPYTYTWSNGASGATVSNLAAGKYTVTVKDDKGCTTPVNVDITEPAALVTTMTTKESSCGNSNGEASVAVSGGTGPYTYAWTPGNSTGATISNLAPGNYSVVVTDANGCQKRDEVTVNGASALQITGITKSDILCNGSNTGTATATVLNGTAPYRYSWVKDGINYANPILKDVSAGEYLLTVTDEAKCTATGTVTITEPAPLSHTVSTIATSCGNANGSATIIETGGTTAYAYSWSPSGGTANSASGLAAGNYLVTVKDANQCIDTVHVHIASSIPLSAEIAKTVHVSCSGGSNGSVAVSVKDGTGPYKYLWSTGATSAAVSNLTAGNYSVTATDQKGCSANVSTQVTQPAAPLKTSVSATNTNCNISNGSATVVASGGTAPFTYAWKPGNYTTAGISNLAAGSYVVTVTDQQGCQKNDTAVINSKNTPVISSIASTDVLCAGQENGSATVVVTSGTAPYNYRWTNGVKLFTEEVIRNAGAGNYDLAVTDAAGCKTSGRIFIKEPGPLQLTVVTTDTKCGNNNGSANAVVKGGTAPFKYAWSTGGVSSIATDLRPGNYQVTVTDANNCTVAANQVPIKSSVALRVSLGKDTVICPGNQVTLSPGNFASYTWQDNSHAPTFKAARTGTYSVTVVDMTGCSATASVKVDVTCQDIVFPSAFTPNGDRHNDLFGPLGTISAVNDYTLRIFNRWGQLVFTSNNPYQKWDGKFKGSDPGTGAFVWISEYSFNGQAKRLQKGTVVLIK
ncbi:MAG: hypothetical protein JWQ40_857 [Segetibacter sp.]|nr:hypothetical protein [Segetibacter sp.]